MKSCNQCGKCCIKYGGGDLSVTTEEIEMWELFNPEIAEYVRNDEIWFDPKSGKRLERCPFLEVEDSSSEIKKYTCSIYLNRPEDCRHYPSLISEMIRDECEMIEVTDLEAPAKSQKVLDELMHESRSSNQD